MASDELDAVREAKRFTINDPLPAPSVPATPRLSAWTLGFLMLGFAALGFVMLRGRAD